MAHYALLNSSSIVTQVITGFDEGEGTNWEQEYSSVYGVTVKRTSYNTYANTHSLGGTPYRANFAGVGFTYDTGSDVFYAPQPYNSWNLNTGSFVWEAPIELPGTGAYDWNEVSQSWDSID